MSINETKIQTGQDIRSDGSKSLIDFDKFRTALNSVNLMSCHGSVIKVSGLTIESSGPQVGADDYRRIVTKVKELWQ